MEMPQAQALVDGGDGVWTAVISAYLFEHPAGRVLIDTGYGRVTAQGGKQAYPGRLFGTQMKGFEMGQPVADQLQVAPDLLVVTHMHADHAGGLVDFPDTPLLVDPLEWEAANRYGLVHGYVDDPYRDRTLVQDLAFDSGPVPSAPMFERSHDLFGDGSLVLIPAPGHTPGSMLVLVNERILLTGDTAWVEQNWKGPTPKGKSITRHVEFDWEEELLAQERIRQWAEAAPDRQVICGHDPSNAELPSVLR